MSKLFKTSTIASVAYKSMKLDRGVFSLVEKKNKFNKGVTDNVELHSKKQISSIEHSVVTDESESKRRNQISNRESEKLWPLDETFSDTSKRYRRSYSHMGLRSRISRNSGGSLPRQIHHISSEEIESEDRNTVKSYVTPSRGCRKCCITVFTACAKMAGWSLGFFKNCQKHPYSCKPIVQSVRELGKNTNAGADTFKKKNDVNVQSRVIQQVKDLFKKPNSYKLFSKPITDGHSQLLKMYSLPEVIYHRFQAVYDSVKDVSIEKSRVVWCVPYSIVSLENIFFGNLIQSTKEKMIQTGYSIYPIGLTNYQTGQRSVKTLRDTFRDMRNNEYSIYSLDFSKFDSTIPNWSKDIFFSIVKSVSSFSPIESKIYDYLRIYIKHTPFVYLDELHYKQKGISSGLLITNLFDTWWNLTLHYFVSVLKEFYPHKCEEIMSEKFTFDKMYLDSNLVKDDFFMEDPYVRVMGDDSIFLCDDYTFKLLRSVCSLLGMKVTIKHITKSPDDDIFFLGRYWNINNRPFQTPEYIALRITYTRWYDDRLLPFDLRDLHLNRILSICLPLVGGKEFLDKYLFDYEPYQRFNSSREGFIFMKDFIEDTFRYTSKENALNVDSY